MIAQIEACLDPVGGVFPGGALPGATVPRPGQGAAVASYVSLFLLLLVFFIVLFSIAAVEATRSHAVLDSLNRAFDGLPSRLGLLPRDPEREVTRRLRAALLPILATAPTAAGAQSEPESVSMNGFLAIDPNRLFLPRSAALAAAGAAALDRLALDRLALDRDTPPELRERLVWRLTPTPDDLAVERAAAAADYLFEHGVPADALAVALSPRTAKDASLPVGTPTAGGGAGALAVGSVPTAPAKLADTDWPD